MTLIHLSGCRLPGKTGLILPGSVNATGFWWPCTGIAEVYKLLFLEAIRLWRGHAGNLGLGIGSVNTRDIQLSPRFKSWRAHPSRVEAPGKQVVISSCHLLTSASPDLREGQISRKTPLNRKRKGLCVSNQVPPPPSYNQLHFCALLSRHCHCPWPSQVSWLLSCWMPQVSHVGPWDDGTSSSDLKCVFKKSWPDWWFPNTWLAATELCVEHFKKTESWALPCDILMQYVWGLDRHLLFKKLSSSLHWEPLGWKLPKFSYQLLQSHVEVRHEQYEKCILCYDNV